MRDKAVGFASREASGRLHEVGIGIVVDRFQVWVIVLGQV